LLDPTSAGALDASFCLVLLVGIADEDDFDAPYLAAPGPEQPAAPNGLVNSGRRYEALSQALRARYVGYLTRGADLDTIWLSIVLTHWCGILIIA
jgi:hypothetical protein